MHKKRTPRKLFIHLLIIFGLFVCNLGTPLILFAETDGTEDNPVGIISNETEQTSEEQPDMESDAESETIEEEDNSADPETEVSSETEGETADTESAVNEVPESNNTEIPVSTEDAGAAEEISTEAGKEETNAVPEEAESDVHPEEPEGIQEITYDASVITAVVPPETTYYSFETKFSLSRLLKQFPEELTVICGGTVREDTEMPEDRETIQIPVSWKCLQKYDDELTDFEFVPVFDGYTIREGLELPVITMHTDNGECGLVNGYLEVEEDYEAPFVEHEGGMLLMAKAPLPASYNGYEEGKLPPVRNQGYEGACWSFSAIGAVEADLIRDGSRGTDVDFSELQLAYFSSHTYTDPKNGNAGDSAVYIGSGNYLDNGGNTTIAYRSLANMVGPVNESDVPYSSGSKQVPDNRYAVSSDAAQVIGAYRINRQDRDSIKQAILDHGAVEAPFFATTGTYTIGDETYKVGYSWENGAFYGTYPKANHSILLVGWNDAFPKENFLSSCQPPEDGAWLVRNSWGYEGYDLPGYFWLSYCDQSIQSSDYTAYDATNDVFDNCYAFDSVPFPGTVISVKGKADSTVTTTLKENFTVDEAELIEAIGFETGSVNLSVTATVTDGKNTTSGSLQTTYAGFYVITLDNPLPVYDQTEVTVTLKLSGKEEIRLPYEKSGSELLGNIRYTASCGSGGFTIGTKQYAHDARVKLYTNNNPIPVTGVELSKTELTMKPGETETLKAHVLPDEAGSHRVTWNSSDPSVAAVDSDGTVTAKGGGTANITVTTASGNKTAVCKVTVIIPVSGVSLKNTSLVLDKGKSSALSVIFSPANATNRSVFWSSSNTGVATVDTNGNVTAKGAGTAVITVRTADGNKTASCKITVKVPVTEVKLSENKVSLGVGKNASLTAQIIPSDATNNKVVWKSSDSKIASVTNGTITAYKRGSVIITASSEDGNMTASCSVTVDDPAACTAFGFCHYNGKDYWYENDVRQAIAGDPKVIIDEQYHQERGREIYDPETNAWYWLDYIYDGAKATGKEVWVPYIYQDEDTWDDARKVSTAYESDSGMGECVLDAIRTKKGKWVRYDENGKMLKGWVTIEGALANLYPKQRGNRYYYDHRTGLMAKGW